MARAIRPVHTPMDGDTLFVLATGALTLSESRLPELALIGSLAADCVARAVARAVYAAESLGALVVMFQRQGSDLVGIRRWRHHATGAACRASIFAAQMKSFSDKPPIACVE